MKQSIDINQVTADELRTLDAIRSRKESIWQNICSKADIAHQPAEPKVVKMPRKRWSWMGVAASVAVLIAVGATLFFNSNKGYELGDNAIVMTADTDRECGVLEDGTIVRLAQGTTMRYDLSSKKRVVVLDGQASFSVKRDEQRPFVVHLNGRDSKVEVLGTSFVVENLKDRDRFGVKVKSGKVRIATPFGTADLSYGEKVVVDQELFEKKVCSTSAMSDWDANRLELKEATLKDVVSELMDLYPEIKKVEEKPTGLIDQKSDILVTSKFDNETLETVLKELSLHFGIKMEFVGGSLTLTR